MKYEEHLELNRYADNTIKNYLNYARLFQNYERIYGITQEGIDQFLRQYNHNVSRAFLKSYLTFAHSEKLGTIKIERMKGRPIQKLKEWYTRKELDILMNNSPHPYNLLWKVSFEAGLRISEALALTKQDVLGINDNGGIVISLKGKTRKTQVSERTQTELEAYIRTIDSVSERLFPYDRFHIHYVLKKLSKKLFPAKKRNHSHMMRISCATFLLRKGVNLKIIQRYLGHSHINTTTKYTQITESDVRGEVKRVLES